MTMPDRTYLTTEFKEKDKVKALGARWDPAVRRWYVPQGLDLAPFSSWLPAETERRAIDAPVEPDDAVSTELSVQVSGVPLSRLLGGVAGLVASAFREGVWTTAEVLKASVSKGHYFLELAERSPTGQMLAQARAIIWAKTAEPLLTEFKRVTGAQLDAGIKVLIRARPVFKPAFGFSLEVDGLEPSYTLGDLEARKRSIRERLKREGLFDRNRSLPAPWDYNAVLVVAPERAAGLGDFVQEAQRLQANGVCQFSYVSSRFQGEGAAAEIVEAIQRGLRSWAGPALPDAIVIIRGGGSVNDLAWLNDYDLARCVCECPVPVLTGIGHQRDDTSIDEVAHRRFDTPSKVIAGIEDVVRLRAQEAKALHEFIINVVREATAAASAQPPRLLEQVAHAAQTIVTRARSEAEAHLTEIRHRSELTLQEAKGSSRESVEAVKYGCRSQIANARRLLPAFMMAVRVGANAGVSTARHQVNGLLPLIVEWASARARALRQGLEHALRRAFESAAAFRRVRVRLNAELDVALEGVRRRTRWARDVSVRAMAGAAEHAGRCVALAKERSSGLFREIAGQGPEKTLRRGFAVVRSESGRTVTSVEAAAQGSEIEIELHDGTISARTFKVKKPRKKRSENHQ